MLANRTKASVYALMMASGLMIGGVMYNYLVIPNRANRELAIKLIPLAQTVCKDAKVLDISYSGTFQVPTKGVYLEASTLNIELALSASNTIACQFLGPAVRDYASASEEDRVILRRAIYHHTKEIKGHIVPLHLKDGDVAALLTDLDDVERFIPSPPSSYTSPTP